MFKKIADGIKATWNFLEGKKRRIALLSGLIANTTKSGTVVNYVAQGLFVLLGGADAADATKKFVKEKLPGGKRK